VARNAEELTGGGFQIRSEVMASIAAHAREAQPLECCGMLLGAVGRIEESVPARNLADAPNRFLIDPRDHIAARRTARGRGLAVVGFYHSHPHTPAWPSPTDVAEATYADAVYLIVSLAGGAAEARLFRIEQGMAIEVPLVLVA
jgi:proteasome lid subunit RPN8/RPN11